LQPFYRERFGYKRGDFPVTEYRGDVSLALPFSGVLTRAALGAFCHELHEWTRSQKREMG
jgi:bifunctional DNA-binding transcriptional regulator/antitoxin component of YhaV-PrlF toxin-antitoxin module